MILVFKNFMVHLCKFTLGHQLIVLKTDEGKQSSICTPFLYVFYFGATKEMMRKVLHRNIPGNKLRWNDGVRKIVILQDLMKSYI